jgi:putative ABC transport system substrate-binding protein
VFGLKRRDFITLLGGAAAAWPLAARAQQTGRAARIGVFTGATIPVMATAYRAFVDELRRLGFGEGQNLIIELRPGDQERFPYKRLNWSARMWMRSSYQLNRR